MGQADEALLASVAAGDTEALTTLVRRHQQRVFGLAMVIVGDRGRAEDVAQEAFVRAWRHAEGFDPRRGTPMTWLLTITRNLALDALRAQRVRRAEPLEGFLAALQAPDTPDEQAVQRTDADRVRQALRSIPEPQQRAVLLAVFGGRTAREVSEIESIPLGTAKTRIRDGLHRLRQLVLVGEARR